MVQVCVTVLLLSLSFVALVVGHGRLVDPPNRSSMWRIDRNYPPNYNDNQNNCGGVGAQYGANKGKCGVCGDNYSSPHPQANENTGKYGRGRIIATYPAGTTIEVKSHITANHRGYIQYHVCCLKNSKAHESGEECFIPLQFESGVYKYPIKSSDRFVSSRIRLSKGLKGNHCTLRWTYTAGNNWGICEDGTGALGCGSQETFRSCSDIAIV